MPKPTVTRYHPLLVLLHWLLAVLILGALGLGFFVLAPMQDADPAKIGLLRLHMASGMAILLLMALRFVTRLLTARPAPLAAGGPGLSRLAAAVHYGFYALVLIMVGSGFATAILSGLNLVVFGGVGTLSTDLAAYPSFSLHVYGAILLAALLALHVLAAFWHHYARRDAVFQRMWFGRRSAI